MVNYFELMGLPIDFNLDKNQLDITFRTLQIQYHPDIANNSANQTSTSQNLPSLANLSNEQASAVINTAYHTLKNSDSRATHLLELINQADGLQDSIRDLDFLDNAMDLRISLDEADMTALPSLKAKLQDWITQVEQNFYQAYQTQNWQTAKTATQQLKFLIKLQHDFAKKTDELVNQAHDNDDDLYV
ncbi:MULTISPECIES: Fe-S protein assembly co-chaperone HscB [unclassified Moraxella]|uniref:Fe-S protein assembly co-chaperone HscB n=1 Tax=unclassified Moraxella TaxID=2685852 RepID=UPI003AF4A80A